MDPLASFSRFYEKKIDNPDFDILTALCVVSAIQLASRHPKYNGPGSEIAIAAARKLSESIIKIAPDLATVLELGWNPEFDS